MPPQVIWMPPALALAIGYVLGSIPFGVILTKLGGAGDLRTIGSGNIGATNVLRTGRKGLAAATLLLDLAKGAAAVWIVAAWMPDCAPLAAAGAFVGHCYPVWLGFRGGKGVATLMGIALALFWPLALIYAAVWLGLLAAIRISSVAGMAAAVSAPVAAAGFGRFDIVPLLIALALIVVWKHRENIERLLGGDRAQDRPAGRPEWLTPIRTRRSALDRLRLIRTGGVGPVTYRQLVARFGGPAEAIEALPMLARRGGGAAPRVPEAGAIRREMARVAALGARYVFLDDLDYPPLLAELENAPVALTLRGDLALLRQPCVAMVGARNASAAACRFARELAHGLGAEAAVVVSGLARGIDTAAHVGSLPRTVAVIAGGIDNTYPPENAELQERIAQEGLLIAEMPPGTEPHARHFPYRNRVIAGLALGTVVVEAVVKSGSLITARLAGEAGREVMAVPGSPLDPRAQGCNQLIRDGATLVQSAADILEQVRPIDARAVRAPADRFAPAPAADADDGARRRIVELLGPVPVAIDELIRQAGLEPGVVATVLLELELGGRLERHAGARVSMSR